MFITFNNIVIHNFLSYGHAEIELRNRHYCLVSGVNNDVRDNAASNGAGKSTWSSAICWALTGETIQGLSTNIKNINVEEDSCYVMLDFSVDDHHYNITRTKNPKSDLRIQMDGNDISGKGIRESEAILKDHLPELTSQLLASIIILGQGLPYKFTSNTPSGRKEVLESLSKSDFMIKDLKERLAKRQTELNVMLRELEDATLSSSSQKAMLEGQLKDQQEELITLQNPRDFIQELSNITALLENLKMKIADEEDIKTATKLDIENIQQSIFQLQKKQDSESSPEISQFNSFRESYDAQRMQLQSEILTVNSKIKELEAITDICPTCGQKIIGVSKPDTSSLKAQLQEMNYNLSSIEKTYRDAKVLYDNTLTEIRNRYQLEFQTLNETFQATKTKLDTHELTLKDLNTKLTQSQVEYNKIINEQEGYTNALAKLQDTISHTQETLKKLTQKILYNINEKESLSEHIKVINQMNTLIKRDFRGYLLSNVISYIHTRAKEYCEDIFKTSDLDFNLSGNNIEVTYGGKSFENLSGGEKQRVDLILQFAIRDMMRQYLGFSSNILILDEIFDQLDNIGCNNVLNLISNKINDVESIFIISHRAGELEIPYDCEMIVTKNTEGVSSVR